MVYLKRILRFFVVMTALVAVMSASLVLVGPQVVAFVGAHRSNHDQINLAPLAERSYIYDSLGNKKGTLINAENQNRVQVKIEDVPETVKGSILAVEDDSFYEHKGINVRSIGRAVDANLDSGSVSQGGSTITQQVVKNSLLSSEQNLARKLREAFLAVELEKQMSKDEILERYLNSVYFGGGAYGVQAAAQYYFGKDVQELNWSEGALMAAIIRNPNGYDPFKNPKLAKERRTVAFSRLVATERLTTDEVAFLEGVPLPTSPNIPAPPDDYFTEQVKQQLLDDPKFGLGVTPAARNQTVFSGGISVYTTLDPTAQAQAVEARDATLPNNKGNGTFDVRKEDGTVTYGTEAIASIQPRTGAVRVLVGGPGYEVDKSRADLTGLPGRQPGSTMKVFTLAALFENGYLPTDTVSGGRCVFRVPGASEDTKPVSGKGGTGTIKTMTTSSNNCGYLRLAQVVGNDKVVDMARRLGVRSSLEDGEGDDAAPPFGLTLGTKNIAPIDMAAAYSVFANDGVRNAPYFVEKILDRDGKVLYQHQAAPERVIEPQVARLVNQVLEANVQSGTGRNAQLSNSQPSAGKTGTTNDSTDVWFVGYTPELSTAIWMGAPTGSIPLANAGLGGATGGAFPAKTWGYFYDLWTRDRPITEFLEPEEADRSGKNVGKIPNEVGGRGSRSSGTRRRTTNNGGGGGGGGGTTATTTPSTPTTAPATTAPPVETTQPGFTPTTGAPADDAPDEPGD